MYRFLVVLFVLLASGLFGAAALAQAAPPVGLVVRGLPDDAPLAVTAARDGLALRVHVKLQSGWHLYGRDTGGGQPVAVEIVDGAFAAAGPLRTPMDDAGLIRGDAALELPLRRVAEGEPLQARMRFMVCDALQCLPPIELVFTTPAAAPSTPAKVLLVGIDDGERTQRIAAFLTERGFVPTVTTYAKVTAALCDAHDVVLADSPTFGQTRGKGVDAAAFPATSAPIVAVGFLGTQLLAGQKVAMACGYI